MLEKEFISCNLGSEHTIPPVNFYSPSNPFSSFNLDGIFVKGLLYVDCYAFFPLHPNFTGYVRQMELLYKADSSSPFEHIDYGTNTESGAYFDITKLLVTKKYLTGSIYIKNLNMNYLIKVSSSGHFLEIDYHPADSISETDCVVSNELNESVSFSYDFILNRAILQKNIYHDLFKFDFSVSFNCQERDISHPYFPKGWNISVFGWLDITRENEFVGNITSITYYDGKNIKHTFEQVNGQTNLFYAKDGSHLILRVLHNSLLNQGPAFELFSDLSQAKQEFDYSGNIVHSNDDYLNDLNFSYGNNSITVDDGLIGGNSLTITKDTSNNTYSIKSNNSMEYVLSYNSSNQLVSISHNSKTDTITYDSNGNVVFYETDDGYELNLTYVDDKVSNIQKLHNNIMIENDTIEYDYLKVITTNRYGVKSFIMLDDELNVSGSGEVVDQKDNRFFVRSKTLLDHDIALSLSKQKSIRAYYDENQGLEIDASLNSETTLTVFANADQNYPLVIKQGKRYILFATLEKAFDYPFNNNRYVEIDVIGSDNNNPCGTLTFHPNLETQTVAIDFVSDLTETSSNKLKIKIRSKINYESINGIDFSMIVKNISIVEYKGQMERYYSSEDSNFVGGSPDPIEIDDIDWYEFSRAESSSSGTKYSFEDLVRNYFNIARGNHFCWSNDGHTLTYNTSGGNNDYTFYPPINGLMTDEPLVNAMLGKKTLVKQYEENGVVKEIFEFSYIKEDDGEFEFITIKSIGGQTSKVSKKYDSIFNLIEEFDESSDLITNHTYLMPSLRRLSSSVTKNNTSQDTLITKQYTTDIKGRITSISTTENGFTASIGFTYQSNYELVATSLDEYSNSESYTYDSFKENIAQISKGNVSIDRSISTNTYTFTNDSEFAYSFSDNSEETTFKIKTGETNNVSTYVELVKYIDTYNQASSYQDKCFPDGTILRNVYDEYSRLVEKLISTDGVNFSTTADYYYFDNHENIESIVQFYIQSALYTYTTNDHFTSGMNAKLRKVFDFDAGQVIDYKYTDDNQIKEVITVDLEGNPISTITYTYDKLGRVVSISYLLEGTTSYTKSITYKSDFDNSVTKIIYSINNETCTQQITYDQFNRISIIKTDNKKTTFNYGYSNTPQSPLPSNPLEVRAVTHSIGYLTTIGGYDRVDGSMRVSCDKRGNVLVNADALLNSSNSNNYEYDNNDRLLVERNHEQQLYISYQFDNNGNIIKANYENYNGITPQFYIDEYKYDSVYKDKLIKYNFSQVNYDANMNISSIWSIGAYSWGYGHRLMSYSTADFFDPIITNYRYNRDGIRTEKYNSDNSITSYYYLEGNDIIAEARNDSNGAKTLIFLYGINGVFGFYYDGNFYTYKKNILGDIIAIFSGNNIVATYQYQAYGSHRILNSNGDVVHSYSHIGTINPFRYRGYYYDNESSLFYCKNRYYSPQLRRWISPDDEQYFDSNTLFGTNLYAYCMNNPVKNTDPDGKFALLTAIIIGAIIGAVSGAAFGALTAVTQGETGEQVFFSAAIGFFTGAIMGAFAGAASHVVVGTVGSYLVATSLNTIGGIVSSGLNDALNQVRQYGTVVDIDSIGWSVLQGGIISFISSPASFLNMNNEPFLNSLAWDFMSTFPFDMISYTVDMIRWKKK